MSNELYIPKHVNFSEIDVWRWYQNINYELDLLNLTDSEREHFFNYYHEAGLLLPQRIDFFRQHYSKTFYLSARFLLKGKNKTVLDLGAGSGTQALFFALQGAHVLAVDMDTIALKILKKRKQLYENLTGVDLNIDILEINAFELDDNVQTKIDAVWSMFAFNIMQPSDRLIDRLLPLFSEEIKLAILDGNNLSWLPRLLPSRRRNVWSPYNFQEALEGRGFNINSHSGGIAIPPALWRIKILHSILTKINNILCRSWLFSISHLIMASKIRNDIYQ